jgi:hypothetical protein
MAASWPASRWTALIGPAEAACCVPTPRSVNPRTITADGKSHACQDSLSDAVIYTNISVRSLDRRDRS